MIIVYTPMAEDAVLMAAALGGIQNQKRSTLNFAAAKEELQELMTLYSKNGFISGYVGSEDAIFTWGDSLLREKEENFLQNEASKFAYEASYAPCSDQVEQAEIVSKLFSSPKHEIIYDASLYPGDQNFQMLCSYSGAENKAHHKITIEEMTEDGIQAAFEKPMGMQETKAHMMSEKNRIYTKNAAAKMLTSQRTAPGRKSFACSINNAFSNLRAVPAACKAQKYLFGKWTDINSVKNIPSYRRIS